MPSRADETGTNAPSDNLPNCPCCGGKMYVTTRSPNSLTYKCGECGLSDTKLT